MSAKRGAVDERAPPPFGVDIGGVGTEEPQSDPGCGLCLEFSGAQAPLHTEMMPCAQRERILLESKHFVVVPSIGPLRAGHVLVLPRRHAFGTLRLAPELVRECASLVQRCEQRLAALYEEPILLFEHGSTPALASQRSTCIAHAHLHVLPGPEDFVPHIIDRLDAPRPAWRALKSLHVREPLKEDYLMVGVVGRNQRLFLRAAPPDTPSQFFRRYYAEYVNLSRSWDWRFEPGEDMFMQTIADWRAAGATAFGSTVSRCSS